MLFRSAYEANPAPPALYIDNQYVAFGIANCIKGRSDKYVSGPDADLWERLVLARPRTAPTWIPAHMDLPAARARGFSDEEWQGNRQADLAANAATAIMRPAPALVAKRMEALADVRSAQAVILAVQRAVLDAAHEPVLAKRSRAARTKRLKTAIFTRLRTKREVRIRRHRPRPVITASVQHPGVHDLRPMAGPRPPGLSMQGAVSWTAECHRCGVTAPDTARWTMLAKRPCAARGPHPAQAVAAMHQGLHDLRREDGAFRCTRCHRGVPVVQRAKAARQRCPVPVPLDAFGSAVEAAIPALRSSVLLATRWKKEAKMGSRPGQ